MLALKIIASEKKLYRKKIVSVIKVDFQKPRIQREDCMDKIKIILIQRILFEGITELNNECHSFKSEFCIEV